VSSERVLFVNPGTELGGAEQSLLLLLQGLRTHGVESGVALFGDGPFRAGLSGLGIPAVNLAVPSFVRKAGRYTSPHGAGCLTTAALVATALPAASRLAALARRMKATLIHTNGMKAHLLGGLAGRMTGIPVVWHLRDFPPDGLRGRLFRGAARRLPALVLVNSEAVGGAIRATPGGRPRVRRLYNPVDLSRFHPATPRGRIRGELGLSGAAPLVGLIAHLTPWKGHELFLTIARAVADMHPPARFIVVGGPIYGTNGHQGYLDRLRARAAALGLSDRVAFLGARSDVPEILADVDVLVHCPTAPEPFGRAVAEAMAAGRPVVAARCGGIPEIIEDGAAGLLVEPGDAKGFAAAVAALLDNADRRARLGAAGRRRAETLFQMGTHTAAVLEAYRTVMDRAGARS